MAQIDPTSGKAVRANIYAGNNYLAEDAPDANLSNSPTATQLRITDQVGSLRGLVDLSGNIPQECTAFPYGDMMTCKSGGINATGPGLFTGKDRDSQSDLDYFGARYYNSTMGRFVSPDPSGLYYADPTNPQSFNLYSYALNNPLGNTDPTGLFCYYGDPNSASDQMDPSQFDYHSSQADCEAPDENGNVGQWTKDAETHYTASGWVDNDNRTEAYAIGMDTSTDTSPIKSSADLLSGISIDAVVWIGGYLENTGIAATNLISHAVGGPQYPKNRYFGTHYCGPGGAGKPTGVVDSGCKVHDDCLDAAGLSASNNTGGTVTLAQASALQACNQALYGVARRHSNAVGATSLRLWLRGGDIVPRPFGILALGTEAAP
jgi:RHS repeat-associated protein